MIDQSQFRYVLGHFASGVVVVTATEEEGPVGFTCQSFSALSLDPPMVVLAPAKSSTSWPRIARAGYFGVNILSSSQAVLGRTFSRRGVDRFEGIDRHAGATGAPMLAGTLAWVECRLGAIYDAGDHELVTGYVVSLGSSEGRPLVFYRSGFETLKSSGTEAFRSAGDRDSDRGRDGR